MLNHVKTALLLREVRTEIGAYVDATTLMYQLILLLCKSEDPHPVLEVQKFNQDGPWNSLFTVSVNGRAVRPLYDQRSGEVFSPQEHWD